MGLLNCYILPRKDWTLLRVDLRLFHVEGYRSKIALRSGLVLVVDIDRRASPCPSARWVASVRVTVS